MRFGFFKRQSATSGSRTATAPLADVNAFKQAADASIAANDFAAAVISLRQATALDATDANSFNTLAFALQQIGLDNEAEHALANAIALAPALPDAHYQLGALYLRQGSFDKAIRSLRLVVMIAPDFLLAYQDLALALYRNQQYDEALKLIADALERAPDTPALHLYRGNLYSAQKDYPQAVASFSAALALDPAFSEAHCNLGLAYAAQYQYDHAIEAYRNALRYSPQMVDAYCNMGLAYYRAGDFSNAEQCYRQALQIDPRSKAAHNNLGMLQNALVRLPEARDSFESVLAIDATDAKAHCNLALLLLLTGDYVQGWQKYEYRWEDAGINPGSESAGKLWLGRESLAGKTILLHAEQGFGDTVQFARYVEVVAGLGASVFLVVQPSLKLLFKNFSGAAEVFSFDDELPRTDFQTPLLSLPLALGTTLDTIPNKSPYLTAPVDRTSHWRQQFSAITAPKIGLVWSGNRENKNDHIRSIAFATFAPLLENKNLRFFCMQTEIRESDQAALASYPDLIQMAASLTNFAETAAIISNLDLVITVDSAVAHLAGALGKPVWVLLPFAPDFRWGLDSAETRWYPTARLFRQKQLVDWSGVVQSVASALQTMAAG